MHRELLGTWDCREAWHNAKRLAYGNSTHAWLTENVEGVVDLDFVYRVEFWDEHHNDDEVFHKAVIYRFAKHPERGGRYIVKDSLGNPVVDEEGNSRAAKLDPVKVDLKSLPPEEMR